MSFSARAVRRMAQTVPGLPTVLLLDPVAMRRWDAGLPRWAHTSGPGITALRQDPGYVRRCRARGHDVYTWTVDDPEDMRRCAEWGVRYLATNTPAVARQVLDA